MSFTRNSIRTRSFSTGRQPPSRFHTNDSDTELPSRVDSLPNVLPELAKIVRKLLPQEIPLNIHVRNVEYSENGYERLSGTLYLTIFRLVFAPDNEVANHNVSSSGNKYLSEYDIPLTSIYKIIVAPVDTRSGFKSFLNENQIQSETRTFTIITRDFRNITFSKCSVTKSNSIGSKQQISATKMETYINALKIHCRFQERQQLYPYLILQKPVVNSLSPRVQRGYTLSSLMSSSGGRSIEDDIADFCASNDERIKSYLTYQDWNDELNDANEKQWVVDQMKFDKAYNVQDEGPFVRLRYTNENDNFDDLIWHWTHTPEIDIDRRQQQNRRHVQYMLVTMPGIGEITIAGDPVESTMSIPTASTPFCSLNVSKKVASKTRSTLLDGLSVASPNKQKKTTTCEMMITQTKSPSTGLRRPGTDSSLTYSCHYVHEQSFQRYNLAKFPCNLKRLHESYDKLIDICAVSREDDDEKWLTKLNTCKWLKYVSKALHGAASLAKLLNYKNIQLAGSDRDNSCLMSSLIQIFLRPKCRTIKGFCELIVREWLIRGHPFRERFGQVLSDIDGYTAQEAPVFLLFLDCVHQLINQNPFSFEFTDYLLLELYYDVCYCYQHTFAFNSVRERLYAINNYPRNTLLLSSFDFSLYLYPDKYRLLKNNASVFTTQRNPFLTHTFNNRSPVRVVYRLESPRASNLTRENSSLTNGSSSLNAEQFEYNTIESPQKFASDLQVDWRIFNIVLWSKCYCRYDQNYMPPLREQQLLFEINCLQEDINNASAKSRRHITLDIDHTINYANSWHPQMLETHV